MCYRTFHLYELRESPRGWICCRRSLPASYRVLSAVASINGGGGLDSGGLRGPYRLAAALIVGASLAAGPAFAQAPFTSQTGGANSSTPASQNSAQTTANVERTIRGEVVNALDGSPISRVLVTIGSRSVLTDSRGQFQFPDYTATQATVTLMKPGFSQSIDGAQTSGAKRLVDLDATAELKLYPDAVITGTVTGRDGLPLSHVPVTLRRAIYLQGEIRWQPTRTSATNLRGEYRFREPAGRYQVVSSFVERSLDTGEAILPVSFPAGSGSDASTYFNVSAGEEKHVDLRPRTGPAYTVPVRVDGPETRGVQFVAVTGGGDSFQVQGGPGQGTQPGVYHLSLPIGTYTLQAHAEARDMTLEGSTRTTVTGPRTDPVVVQLEPAAVLPVELAVDPASAETAASSGNLLPLVPDLRQFNLRLHNLAGNAPVNAMDIPLRQREDRSYEFRVPPGQYRLEANGGGSWYVESATYGVTSLLTTEISIASGSPGAPIRVVVNNASGSLTGTVQMTGAIDIAWVYVIPKTPSVAAINPTAVANTGAPSGTFTMRVPVGEYSVIAFDRRVEADLRNPDVVAKLSGAGRSVEISSAATATVELAVSDAKGTPQ
jgi:hypothetical protein